MSTSTNLTAEQLLELAFRTSRTCRERQRRTAVRAEEERARLAALHGRIDELERALNGADAKRAVHADAARSCASDLAAIAKAVGLGDTCEPPDVLEAVRGAIAERDAMAEPCCECSDLRKSLDEARAAAHEAEERGARWALDGVARLPDGVPPLVPRWELARRICADARTKGGE